MQADSCSLRTILHSRRTLPSALDLRHPKAYPGRRNGYSDPGEVLSRSLVRRRLTLEVLVGAWQARIRLSESVDDALIRGAFGQ